MRVEGVGSLRNEVLKVNELPSGAIASVGRRFAARFIDSLVIGIPLTALVLSQSTIDIDKRVFDTPGWVLLLGATLAFLYEVVCVTWRGQTIGKATGRKDCE